MKPESGLPGSPISGNASYPGVAMGELSRLASDLVEGEAVTGADCLVWPLLAAPDLVSVHVATAVGPDPAQVLVHESLTIHRQRRPGAEERISFLISVSGRGVMSVDFDIRDEAGGELARLQARLRRIDLAALSRARPVPLARAARGADLAEIRTGQIAQSAIDRFLELSGDPNPLHSDAEHARAVGLEGTVIPGAMLAALVEPAVRVLRPAFIPSTLSMRFLAPMISGQAVKVFVGEPAGETARLRIFLADENDGVTALGEVGGTVSS